MDLAPIEAASLDGRLPARSGPGAQAARLVWLVILAELGAGATVHTGATLARRCTLDGPATRRAIAVLRSAELVSLAARSVGAPGGSRRVVLPCPVPRLYAPPASSLAFVRPRLDMDRPIGALVVYAGAYACAAAGLGRSLAEHGLAAPLPCPLADVRRLVGHAQGSAFWARVDALERAGLLRRDRRGRVLVAPFPP